MLSVMLMDNTKAWEHFSDGRYILRHYQLDMPIDSQKEFMRQAHESKISAAVIKRKSNIGTKLLSVFKYSINIIKSFVVKKKK